ncbi:MAG: metallophosphoesterase family protein [Deltaproteobacteria bacterium]|nr:metallophosphoesterase family protein [Deltaproteobacteria bacterium]
MRIAVLSDIHGNLDAFREVLRDMDRFRVDQVICLGDMIGYGPEPEETIRLICERAIPCVMGNHEMAVVKPQLQEWFNPQARESIQKTKALLSSETLLYIHGLPSSRIIEGFQFVHGCPPNSPFIYLYQLSESSLIKIFQKSAERIIFVGHTHNLKLIRFDGHSVVKNPLRQGIIPLNAQDKYIVNAGSVGQPRDGNNAAKYVIADTLAHSLEVRFVPYDIAAVYRKILDAGLPKSHAERLW